jgi:hypothetical protein
MSCVAYRGRGPRRATAYFFFLAVFFAAFLVVFFAAFLAGFFAITHLLCIKSAPSR